MKGLIFTAVLAVLLGQFPRTVAKEIDSQQSGIQIFRQERIGQDGKFAGYDYWVSNTNEYAIRFQIQLYQQENIVNSLLPDETVIAANDELYLGSVTIAEPGQPYRWQYRWKAERAYVPTAANL